MVRGAAIVLEDQVATMILPYTCRRYSCLTGSVCFGKMRRVRRSKIYQCDRCKRTAMNDIAPLPTTFWDILVKMAWAWQDEQFEAAPAVSISTAQQVSNNGAFAPPAPTVPPANIYAAYASAWRHQPA